MRKEHKPIEAESKSMPEAEVTLRLAFWVLDRAGQKSHADIAIGGAHHRIAAHLQAGRWIEGRTVCDIRSFLTANKWHPKSVKKTNGGAPTAAETARALRSNPFAASMFRSGVMAST